MPIFFKIPIPKYNLKCSSLSGWEATKNDIIDALGSQKNSTIPVEDDYVMSRVDTFHNEREFDDNNNISFKEKMMIKID